MFYSAFFHITRGIKSNKYNSISIPVSGFVKCFYLDTMMSETYSTFSPHFFPYNNPSGVKQKVLLSQYMSILSISMLTDENKQNVSISQLWEFFIFTRILTFLCYVKIPALYVAFL